MGPPGLEPGTSGLEEVRYRGSRLVDFSGLAIFFVSVLSVQVQVFHPLCHFLDTRSFHYAVANGLFRLARDLQRFLLRQVELQRENIRAAVVPTTVDDRLGPGDVVLVAGVGFLVEDFQESACCA